MPEDTGADLLQRFVDQALVLKATGGRTALYSQLVTELGQLRRSLEDATSGTTNSVALARLLRHVTGSVGLIRAVEHDELFREVLSVPLWPPADAALRSATLDLILHLAVAVPSAVQPCLQGLVHSLAPPHLLAHASEGALGAAWSAPSELLDAQNDIVGCLVRVLNLVPTAAPRALPVLLDGFPHPLRDRGAHCFYLRAVLLLAKNASALREALLAAAVQHLLALDVEIRWEDIVGAKTDETNEEILRSDDEDEPDLFELEGMTREEAEAAGGGWEGGAAIQLGGDDDGEEDNNISSSLAQMEAMADKLDSLMELTLEYIAEQLTETSAQTTFNTLLAVFERKVINAHRSKFVQFAVFLAVSKDATGHAAERFLDVLLRTLADESAAGLTRTAAAAYTASFLARAQFLEAERVVRALTRLLAWARGYALRQPARDSGWSGAAVPNTSSGMARLLFLRAGAGADNDVGETAHAPFHGAVQAALYVLCYHLDVLVSAFGGVMVTGGGGGANTLSLCLQRSPAKTADDKLVQVLSLEERQNEKQKSESNNAAAIKSSPDGSMSTSSEPTTPPPNLSASPSEQLRWVLTVGLPFLLGHHLDPLSHCSGSVSAEFGRQAHRLRLHALSREVKAWEARAAAARSARRPLEAFFPFDPYLLARSARFLDLPHTFVSWQRGRGALRGGEEEEEKRGNERRAPEDDDSSLSSSSDAEEPDDVDSSSDDDDHLQKTRFGSLPSSSCPSHESWDQMHGNTAGRPIPSALRAALAAGSPASGAASPDVMMMSLGGSPFPLGMSPLNSAEIVQGKPENGSQTANGFPQVAWRTLHGFNKASQEPEPVAMSCTPAP